MKIFSQLISFWKNMSTHLIRAEIASEAAERFQTDPTKPETLRTEIATVMLTKSE